MNKKSLTKVLNEFFDKLEKLLAIEIENRPMSNDRVDIGYEKLEKIFNQIVSALEGKV